MAAAGARLKLAASHTADGVRIHGREVGSGVAETWVFVRQHRDKLLGWDSVHTAKVRKVITPQGFVWRRTHAESLTISMVLTRIL